MYIMECSYVQNKSYVSFLLVRVSICPLSHSIIIDLMSLELKLLVMNEVEIKLGKVRHIFNYKVFLDIAFYCSTRFNLISKY